MDEGFGLAAVRGNLRIGNTELALPGCVGLSDAATFPARVLGLGGVGGRAAEASARR